jgi:hypothetical protein
MSNHYLDSVGERNKRIIKLVNKTFRQTKKNLLNAPARLHGKIYVPMYLVIIRDIHDLMFLKPGLCLRLFVESKKIQLDLNSHLNKLETTRTNLVEYNSLTSLKKHLKKYMRIYTRACIQYTLKQFEKLPGNLPLDLRNHIVSYISIVPVK